MDRGQKPSNLTKVMELLVSNDIGIEIFDTVGSNIEPVFKLTKGQSYY